VHIAPADTPRVLWIELTSKCPFDCVFCSRKVRRGAGRHLPFDVYTTLIESLAAPRKILLNYSGESIYYPELIPAIRLAAGRGAITELVSAFSSITQNLMRELVTSGLGRLTISVHAVDEAAYADIYRYSSFAQLRARLAEFMDLCGAVPSPPAVDFAFVAMQRNVHQLEPVAAFAESMGVRDVVIYPVVRRDEIPVQFAAELSAASTHRPEFRGRLRDAVSGAQAKHGSIRFTLNIPDFDGGEPLGEIPSPYPGLLPPHAQIHSCEQNPWDTAHVLASGDVVVCEVLDREPLGNLNEQPIADIWHSRRYRAFREAYRRGEVAECRRCPWKRAFVPGALKSEILARDRGSPQLLHGWHHCADEDVIWSSQISAAVLRPRRGSESIHVSGLLPQGSPGAPNELAITCNGEPVGRVENRWHETVPFGLDFAVPRHTGAPLELQFRTGQVFRPRERGLGADDRDLGFALLIAASNPAARVARPERHKALAQLRRSIQSVDTFGDWVRRHTPPMFGLHAAPPNSGITVIIPERDNREELEECLLSLEDARKECPEVVQTVVAVNGAPVAGYSRLQRDFPAVEWCFEDQPLGFSQAIGRGLRTARGGWAYLLNNDMRIDRRAIAGLLHLRERDVFAIGSQIFFKDRTRFREETNLTSLRREDGLLTVHDEVPDGAAARSSFYVGGGASLFQTHVLRALMRNATVYEPFYWEDIEWGWRARKLGYSVLFCPASIVHHRHRATVATHYDPDDVSDIIDRNRLLFHLRNVLQPEYLDRVVEELSLLPDPAYRHAMAGRTLRECRRVRLWNHLAAVPEDSLLRAIVV
jgi:radical SAM protein with 4Fe4S-binding SPASM domain